MATATKRTEWWDFSGRPFEKTREWMRKAFRSPLKALECIDGVHVSHLVWLEDGSEYLDMEDSSKTLQLFLIWCAFEVLPLARTDLKDRSRVLETKRRHVLGQADDKELQEVLFGYTFCDRDYLSAHQWHALGSIDCALYADPKEEFWERSVKKCISLSAKAFELSPDHDRDFRAEQEEKLREMLLELLEGPA